MAIAQAMSLNNEIIFINRFALLNDSEHQSTKHNDSFRIIDATQAKYRPKSFFKRNFLKSASFYYEYIAIKRLNKEKKIDWINVYTQYFGIFIFYYLLSKLFHFRIIFHYVEFRSKIKGRNFLYKINDLLTDKCAIHLSDKLIPISKLINDHILSIKPTASVLVIPPVCDFQFFHSVQPEVSDKSYFVFCISTAYEEVILFIIESFLKIRQSGETTLHLVINGKLTDRTIRKLLDENKEKIFTFSGLGYEKLIAKYKGSLAQLIPLRNTYQDCARFPQKICEYLASKRPIITTGFGEITNYFTDNQNAIIATEYDTNSFSQKLEWAIQNQDKIEIIAANSYEIGINLFNIHTYSPKLEKFLTK